MLKFLTRKKQADFADQNPGAEETSLTELRIVEQLLRQQATGQLGQNSTIISTLANYWGNVLSSAVTEPAVPAITSMVLSRIGYELIDRGICIFGINIVDGMPMLKFAVSHEQINNGKWTLEHEIRPGVTYKQEYYDDDVLVFTWSSARRPASPVEPSLRKLAELVDVSPGFAMSIYPRALYRFGVQAGQADAFGLKGKKSDHMAGLKKAAGEVVPVPYEIGTQYLDGGMSEMKPKDVMGDNVLHIGPEYAQSLVNLRQQVWEHVCSACNTPSTLILGKAISAGHREAYRTWLRTSVTPVMRKVETIIKEGLNLNQFTLHIEGMSSADISSLGRAWASMVSAGMDQDQANRLCNFD